MSEIKKRSSQGEFKKLTDLFSSVYLVRDPYVLKTMSAVAISQQIPGDPIWVVIVGASGSGKSEYINSLVKCVGVFPLSTLTSHTFISGMKGRGQETSLLLKIQNGIITFKDLTSLLSEHKDDRSVIMAQLREIYDGKYSKTFGTGETIPWSGKITVIAGSTYAIHTLKQQYTAMGERFLFYNMIQPDRVEAARRTMQNQEEGNMDQKRLMLAENMGIYMNDTIVIPTQLPRITKEFEDEVLIISELSTRARSDVERNYKSPQQEITAVHPPEMPTRFAGQLLGMSRSLSIMNWNEIGILELLPKDKTIIHKLALDSVTMSRRVSMQELSRYESITTAGLAVKLNFPTNTIRRWLEDLNALGIADRQKGRGPQGDSWQIKKTYRDVIGKFEGIEMQHMELIDMEGQAESDEEKAVIPDELKKVGSGEIDIKSLELN